MNRTEQINEFEWLLGSWTNITRDGEYYKTWTREGDSAFSAFSFMNVSGDTVFSEQIILKQTTIDVILLCNRWKSE